MHNHEEIIMQFLKKNVLDTLKKELELDLKMQRKLTRA